MAKGYIIAHIDVSDAETFAEFRRMSAPVIKEYGGQVLVGAKQAEQREGTAKPLTIVVEFPDLDTARRFYESQGYTDAKALRERAAMTDLQIVEGVD